MMMAMSCTTMVLRHSLKRLEERRIPGLQRQPSHAPLVDTDSDSDSDYVP